MCPECKNKQSPYYDFERDIHWCPCGWEGYEKPLIFSCEWCGEEELEEDAQYFFEEEVIHKLCKNCELQFINNEPNKIIKENLSELQ